MKIPLSRPQMAAMKALAPGNTVCLPWGRGGGKSWFLRLAWYLLVLKWDGRYREGSPNPGVRIVVLMPTLEQAKKVHAALLVSELAGRWACLGGKVDRSTWRVTFPGGSWIQWVTSERAKNIAGMRCDVLCLDECDDIEKEVYDAITLPYFTEAHSLRMSLLVGTPRRGRYGLLYRTHARGTGKALDADGNAFTDHFSFHATCYDFPDHVSPLAIEKARLSTPAELFKREWLCDFDAAEGLVYPHFSEAFHVRDPHPGTQWREVIVGADWGFEDPAAIGVFGIAGSGKDLTIHMLHEVYVQHKTDSEIAEYARRIESQWPKARWYGDPSRPQTIESLRREAHINIVGADNAIEDGVSTVADVLLRRARPDGSQWAQFYISRNCTNTIREFGLYRRKRDPRNRERILDDIEDKNNHAMDLARYAIHTHFGGPDKRIREGQRI